MIDVAEPAEDFSVARFQSEARAAIAGVEARGRRALLVGGTGLYLRAVVDDLRFPGEDRALRDAIDAWYEGDGRGRARVRRSPGPGPRLAATADRAREPAPHRARVSR